MHKDSVVAVVVPAYNEASHVGDVIRTMPSFVDRVYAVDDRSTDDTWDEIRRTAERVNERALVGNDVAYDRRVVPVRHEENRGVGGAIKTGYRRALDDDADVVAVMGGDGQMDPALLEAIVDPVVEGRADYAKGNRFLYRETRSNVPPFRLVGNVLLSGLTKTASGYWSIGDSQNGFTAISSDALATIALEDMYEFYGYCNDLLVKLNAADMTVADVPAPIRYEDESSTINYATYVPLVSRMLLRNFFWRLKEKYVVRDFNPVVLLYALGIAGVAVTVAQSLARLLAREDENRSSSLVTNGLISALALAAGMLGDKWENEALARRETDVEAADAGTGETWDQSCLRLSKRVNGDERR